MNNKSNFLMFTFRLAITFFLTYFLVGIVCFTLGLNATGYYEKHPLDLINAFHRDSSSAWVMAGPLFQIVRAFLFSLVLYPMRDVFLERKNGWVYLWLLFLVFSIFAPAGEAPGSIEGIVYTTLPILFHLLYVPELVLQTLAFSWLFIAWEKGRLSKVVVISMIAISSLLLFVTLLGLVQIMT